MSTINWIPQILRNQITAPSRAQKRAARRQRKQPSRRTFLRLEQLEDRVVPSTLPGSTFEMDGNLLVNTPGLKDWATAPITCPAPSATGEAVGTGCALDLTKSSSGTLDNAFGQGTKE